MKARDEISEATRNLARAEKLMGYVKKRYGEKISTGKQRDDSVIDRIKDAYPVTPSGLNSSVDRLRHWEPKAKKDFFFTKELTPAQKTVHTPSVIDKLRGKGPGDHGPIRVASYNGKDYVIDGHHRWMAARARGDETIDAVVHKIPIKGKKRLKEDHFQIGQRVIAKTGIHKGDVHRVLNDLGNDTYRVEPIDSIENKYKSGTANIHADDLETVMLEEVLEEIREHLEQQMIEIFESNDQEAIDEFLLSLSEEQLEILGLLDENVPLPTRRPVQHSTARDKMRNLDRNRVGRVDGTTGSHAVQHRAPLAAGVNPHARFSPGNQRVPQRPQFARAGLSGGAGAAAAPERRNVAPGQGSTANALPSVGGAIRARTAAATAPARPATTTAAKPAAVASKPVARPAPKPMARPAPRPAAKPAARNYHTASANMTPGSMVQRSLGNMYEETQVKESLESFLRNKFLKG